MSPPAPTVDGNGPAHSTFDGAALLAWFAARGIDLPLIEHAPIFTVAEGAAFKADIPGGHSKSLLVEDKSGRLVFICARGDRRVDLRAVAQALGIGPRLSFASPARLLDVLALAPGSVTPLALPRDGARQIRHVVLDEALMAETVIWCHPLRNTASVSVRPSDLLDFITAHHGPAQVLPV